mmetsp:Transcript_48228/g.114693  ORF Transcript_48228/g.114693 Transcript_48228/m.114693 type:complete len:218 (+) Transcript_48228:1381-2034(+)
MARHQQGCRAMLPSMCRAVCTTLKMVWKRTTSWSITWLHSCRSSISWATTILVDRVDLPSTLSLAAYSQQMPPLQAFTARTLTTAGLAMQPVVASPPTTSQAWRRPWAIATRHIKATPPSRSSFSSSMATQATRTATCGTTRRVSTSAAVCGSRTRAPSTTGIKSVGQRPGTVATRCSRTPSSGLASSAHSSGAAAVTWASCLRTSRPTTSTKPRTS